MKTIKESFKTCYSALMTVLLSLVPLFKSCPPCPLCMPKYAAILSFFGIPLADYSHLFTPLMLVSMAATVTTLAYQARKYHFSYLSSSLALASCLWILNTRYLMESIELSYIGMGFLLVAIVKNQKDLSNRKSPCCSH